MFPTGFSRKYALFAWIKVIQLAWLQTYIHNSKVIPSFANLRRLQFKNPSALTLKVGLLT